MRGRLWVFSGLDGAGKSTQIELLQQALTARRRRARRVWMRGGYTPLFVWAKSVGRRTGTGVLPPPGRSADRAARLRSPWLRRIWLGVAIVDVWLYLAVWVRLLRVTGVDVVADRWLEDTEIDFTLNFPEEKAARWLLWRAVRRTVPRPSAHLVFVIPVEESLRRSREKAEPFPDSAGVLRTRLAAYEAIAAQPGKQRMEGLMSRQSLHETVMQRCGLDE